MDEALELGTYLPQSFANANEQAYLDFLWSAFQTNYQAERHEFASLAFHLLYMSFVSFSIWQIRLARPEHFAVAIVGFVESFNGRFRDELLNETLFSTLAKARQQIRAWQDDYNHHRPHSGLGNMTPAEFVAMKGLEMRAA